MRALLRIHGCVQVRLHAHVHMQERVPRERGALLLQDGRARHEARLTCTVRRDRRVRTVRGRCWGTRAPQRPPGAGCARSARPLRPGRLTACPATRAPEGMHAHTHTHTACEPTLCVCVCAHKSEARGCCPVRRPLVHAWPQSTAAAPRCGHDAKTHGRTLLKGYGHSVAPTFACTATEHCSSTVRRQYSQAAAWPQHSSCAEQVQRAVAAMPLGTSSADGHRLDALSVCVKVGWLGLSG